MRGDQKPTMLLTSLLSPRIATTTAEQTLAQIYQSIAQLESDEGPSFAIV
jgi:hypothetical protein